MGSEVQHERSSKTVISKYEDELKFLIKDEQQLHDVHAFVKSLFVSAEERGKKQTDRYLDDSSLTLHGNGTSLRIRQSEIGSCSLDVKMKFVGLTSCETHVYKRREAKKPIGEGQKDALLRGGTLDQVDPELYRQICDTLSLPSIDLTAQFDVVTDRQELAVRTDDTSITFNFDTIRYAFDDQVSKAYYELEIRYTTEATDTPDVVKAILKIYPFFGWDKSKYDRGIYLLQKLNCADKAIDREEIKSKFNLTPGQTEILTIYHGILNRVYQDFMFHRPYLVREEKRILNELQVLLYDHDDGTEQKGMQKKYVHSIRTRVKRAEHLIAKIARKEGKYFENEVTVTKGLKEKSLTPDNYPAIITDLIGVRVLHLFKDNWLEIDEQLSKMYEGSILEKKFYVRKGDEIQGQDLQEQVRQRGFDFEEKESGYRSAHYVIKRDVFVDSGDMFTTYAEIQVRTVFEEAWGEVDHEIRYPHFDKNVNINHFLKTFNRIVGSADEMATYIKAYRDSLINPGAEQGKS